MSTSAEFRPNDDEPLIESIEEDSAYGVSAIAEKPDWMKARQQELEKQKQNAELESPKQGNKSSRRRVLFPMLPKRTENILPKKELTWRQFIQRSVLEGTGLSLLLHILLLLFAGFVGWESLQEGSMFSTIAGFSESDSSTVDVLPENLLDAQEGATASLISPLAPAPEESQVTLDAEFSKQMSDEISKAALENSGSGTGLEGFGTGAGFGPPSGARIVTKGSFAAWTVPRDPSPGENYTIVILVKLPKRVKKYRLADLSGMVVGTDKYRQIIPDAGMARVTKYLELKENVAQLKVRVPGAAALVKDTIQIRSKLLREKQKLEIVF